MRKILITLICMMTIMILGAATANADGMLLEYDGGVHEYDGAVYALVVNNHEIDPPLSPIIFNDRALVPVREIFEEVGATVEYDGSDQSIRIYDEDTTILMFINNNIAYVNGRKCAIPDNVVPKLISKLGGETKTMVPIRFISESIGMPVDFDADAGAILVASDSYDYEDFIPEPEATPAPKPQVTGFAYNITGNTELTIDIQTDYPIENEDDFMMNSPGRLVVDLNGSGMGKYEGTRYVNDIGISTIRLGDNGERARFVVDSEYIDNYSVDCVSDTQLRIVVTTNPPEPTPVPAAKPHSLIQSSAAAADSETPKADAKPSKTFNRAENSTKLVILDAGHGGSDSGAVGTVNGQSVYEKTLTLSITYRVKAILESNGVTVSMTRTGDTLPSLVERPTQANGENAALFVSIHINSADASEAHGIETYYSTENNGDKYGTTSSYLASQLLRNMINQTGASDRGVRTANHAVTRRCNMPASLVECGFISNSEEAALMSSDAYQNKLAQGIADGILNTLPIVTIPD